MTASSTHSGRPLPQAHERPDALSTDACTPATVRPHLSVRIHLLGEPAYIPGMYAARDAARRIRQPEA